MDGEKIRGTPAAGLWGATIGFFTGFAAVSLFGPTVKTIGTEISLQPALAGLLISVPSLTGSLLRIPFAAWVDANGGRKPFLVLLGLSIAGLLGLYVLLVGGSGEAALFPLLLAFGVLGGCGIATFSVGIAQTAYWFPRHRQGTALGIYAGVGNLAPGLFAFLLANITLPRWGLPGSYLIWLLFLVAGTGAYTALGRNPPYFQLLVRGMDPDQAKWVAMQNGEALFPSKRLTTSLKVSAGTWRTWALVLVYFTSFGGFMALTGWFPTYWMSFYGVAAGTAGTLTMAYSLLASAVRVGGGRLSDLLGGENTAIAFLGVMLAGAVVMTYSFSYPLSIAGSIVMALGMGITNAAVFKLVPRAVPDAVGGAAGWVGGLGTFGGFVLPNLLASYIRTDRIGEPGYARGFMVFAVCAAASMAIVAVLKAAAPEKTGEE
jgi:NNP family nitrate/nitrite transporter-like MFS transporter